MKPYLMFPKILPWLIHQQMNNIVLPFAIGAAVVECYLTTMRQVMR